LTRCRTCTTFMYMSNSVIPIAEARRRLSELVRKVAEGHTPIAIGRRGRPEVVIARVSTVAATRPPPLRGLARLLGEEEELIRASEVLTTDLVASLDRTAMLLREPAAPPYRPRRARKPQKSRK
jgi:prevent-host-death family protein